MRATGLAVVPGVFGGPVVERLVGVCGTVSGEVEAPGVEGWAIDVFVGTAGVLSGGDWVFAGDDIFQLDGLPVSVRRCGSVDVVSRIDTVRWAGGCEVSESVVDHAAVSLCKRANPQ